MCLTAKLSELNFVYSRMSFIKLDNRSGPESEKLLVEVFRSVHFSPFPPLGTYVVEELRVNRDNECISENKMEIDVKELGYLEALALVRELKRN